MDRRPGGFWQDLVLIALDRLGGKADLGDITREIERMTEFTSREMEERSHEGGTRYVHTIRSVVNRLSREGRLVRVGHGRYRLPDRKEE